MKQRHIRKDDSFDPFALNQGLYPIDMILVKMGNDEQVDVCILFSKLVDGLI